MQETLNLKDKHESQNLQLTFCVLAMSHHADAVLRNRRRRILKKNVAKGEIGYDEQFLLWPQCFQLY